MAIEVAFSSFCDLVKVEAFARMGLPLLEIDLRAFTPENFRPEAVEKAVLEAVFGKEWLWPVQIEALALQRSSAPSPLQLSGDGKRARLPEEVVTISGRWVSIKQFDSGDIAVKVIKYDPDVVSLVKSIAKANFASYSAKWKSWNVPRWRAEIVRAALREKAKTVSILVEDQGSS